MVKISKNKLGMLGIALALIVACGAYFYISSNNDSAETANDSENSNNSQADAVSTSEGKAENGFLKIPELGVALKLTSSTQDVTYFRKGDVVYLSSESLAKEEPKCAANFEDGTSIKGVATVSFYTDPLAPDPLVGIATNEEILGSRSVEVDGKYFYILENPSMCVNKGDKNKPTDAAYQLETALVTELKSNVKIEKL